MARSDDYMKYALYAGIAYVGYRFAVGQGYIDDFLGLGPLDFSGLLGAPTVTPPVVDQNGNPVQPPVEPPVTVSPPPQSQPPADTGNNTPPGGSGGGGGDIRAQTRAASLDAANQRGGRMNLWEWSYFLPANVARGDWQSTANAAWSGTTLGRKPANTTEAASVRLTFDEWWSIISPTMPGLSGVMGMGYVNHYGQSASTGLVH